MATQKAPSIASLDFKCTLGRSTKSPCEDGSRKEMRGSGLSTPTPGCDVLQKTDAGKSAHAALARAVLSPARSLWPHDLTTSEWEAEHHCRLLKGKQGPEGRAVCKTLLLVPPSSTPVLPDCGKQKKESPVLCRHYDACVVHSYTPHKILHKWALSFASLQRLGYSCQGAGWSTLQGER